jgi:SAM-dependent methyltransferase
VPGGGARPVDALSPPRWRKRLARLRRPAGLGALRRTTPLSEEWGRDRGTPLDRYYIERFLARESQLIRGRVLEVRDSRYTERFGTAVDRSDVLDIDAANRSATIIADLARADEVESDAFDCFILTQTLQYVFDVVSAVRHAHRILRPGGTLLCTEPAVSRIGRRDVDATYWRFTAASLARLLGDAFAGGSVDVRSQGNVLAAVAFLEGMAYEELTPAELDVDDPFFPVLITARATKAA